MICYRHTTQYGEGVLSRDGAWEPTRAHFRDEADSLLFYETLGETGARRGADEQSLRSNCRNARSQRGGGNAMVAEDLYPAA